MRGKPDAETTKYAENEIMYKMEIMLVHYYYYCCFCVVLLALCTLYLTHSTRHTYVCFGALHIWMTMQDPNKSDRFRKRNYEWKLDGFYHFYLVLPLWLHVPSKIGAGGATKWIYTQFFFSSSSSFFSSTPAEYAIKLYILFRVDIFFIHSLLLLFQLLCGCDAVAAVVEWRVFYHISIFFSIHSFPHHFHFAGYRPPSMPGHICMKMRGLSKSMWIYFDDRLECVEKTDKINRISHGTVIGRTPDWTYASRFEWKNQEMNL